LPRMPEEIAKELEAKYSLGSKLATQLVNSDHLDSFEKIVTAGKGVPPSFIATVLTESLTSLSREGVAIEDIGEPALEQIFRLVAQGRTAKESVVEILKWLPSHADKSPDDAVRELGLQMIPKAELTGIISKVLETHRSFVNENGSKALGKMMNLVMAEVRGRADPKLVNELLRSQLENT
jgi:glutamyl-tRNA(Gln) amidotransferase subunit E